MIAGFLAQGSLGRKPDTSVQHVKARQTGVVAVEFSLVLIIFLTVVFGIFEIARAVYILNTLQEVTRRAARSAATTDFSNPAAIDQIRREAIFRTTSGTLAFASPITDKHILIDYMALENDSGGGMTQTVIPTASLPACPTRNRLTCTGDSGNASCIRFVRVRICEPGTDCTPVPYSPITSLVSLPIIHPASTTIVKAESLGYNPGDPLCN